MKNNVPLRKSIQFKLFILVSLATLIVMAGFIAFTNNRSDHNMSVFNDREAERKTTFKNITNLETQNLKSLTIENTYWDEMVAFITDKNQAFENDVLRSQLETYDADVMWTYDKSFNLVSNTNTLPGEFSKFNLNLSPDDIQLIFKDNYLNHFYRNSDVGVIEVYGATVHPSTDVDHETTPQGYFFVARILNQDFLKEIELATDDKLTLVSNSSSFTSDEKSNPKLGMINFSEDLKDENDKVVGQIKVQYFSKAIADLFSSLNKLFIGAILFLIIISALFFNIFKKMILTPLERIYGSLLTDETSELNSLKSDNSEIGRIASLIDKSIKRKQEIAETAARIQKSQAALESRTKEIERINNLMIDRELKMIELKAEIKALKST